MEVSNPMIGRQRLLKTTRELFSYCESNQWAGYDPYDALNSSLFRIVPGTNWKVPRLVLTQLLKRSPINFRPLLLVPKTQNAKGLALFLSATLKLTRMGAVENADAANKLAERLLALRIGGAPFHCWGYNFDWQTRTELVPRSLPNIICTTFVANALLDIYGAQGDNRYLEAARSAANYLMEVLYAREGSDAWFNYTPVETTQIHNANLLGAALVSRVATFGGDSRLLEAALQATRFSVRRQNQDGSWYYGERQNPSQKWIDNFHTGFNLCALADIGEFAGTNEFAPSVALGSRYYLAHFFESDGAPKYFHNRGYPFDVHSAAQSIITLHRISSIEPGSAEMAEKVLAWSFRNLWDSRGYFHYQKHRYWKNRIPYIRWGQAWMLLALATALEAAIPAAKENAAHRNEVSA